MSHLKYSMLHLIYWSVVHEEEKAKLKIMPLEWSRYLIKFFFYLARNSLIIVKIENREKALQNFR